MLFKTETPRPIAKLRATGYVLVIAALLPLLNVLLAQLSLPSVSVGDLDAFNGLIVAAYTAVAGVVAFVRGYLRRPDSEDAPVPDPAATSRQAGY